MEGDIFFQVCKKAFEKSGKWKFLSGAYFSFSQNVLQKVGNVDSILGFPDADKDTIAACVALNSFYRFPPNLLPASVCPDISVGTIAITTTTIIIIIIIITVIN